VLIGIASNVTDHIIGNDLQNAKDGITLYQLVYIGRAGCFSAILPGVGHRVGRDEQSL
jgi:hypothetical protein